MKLNIALSYGIILLPLAATIADTTVTTTAASDDGEWVEEVVIRRRRVAPKPAAEKVAPAPAAGAEVKKKDEPPPPPEPSAEDAAEPRRLVRYFCKCWKDGDYERLWWAMTPQYRKKHPLKKFSKLFTEDKENNGGIVDENIILDDVELGDGGIQVTVDLRYRFKRVGVKRVKAIVEKNGPAYRMRESGIIPLDLDDL